MNIYIASDHGGFKIKNDLVEKLSKDYDIKDLGPKIYDEDDDYPDYAKLVAERVTNDMGSKGILICRSGNGMCIAANKVTGAYAALAFSNMHAQKAREDDNANIICLDSDYEGEDPYTIAQHFLRANFAGMDTRHGRRFRKIQDIEEGGS